MVSKPAPTPAQALAWYWAPFQRWSRWVIDTRLQSSCPAESPLPVPPLLASGCIQWRAGPTPVLRVMAGVTVNDDHAGSYSPLTTMLPLWASGAAAAGANQEAPTPASKTNAVIRGWNTTSKQKGDCMPHFRLAILSPNARRPAPNKPSPVPT